MIFFDTETCGLTGPMVLLQYAENDGEIILHECWKEESITTLNLLRRLMSNQIVGFNLTFDMFQLQKFYTMLEILIKEHGGDVIPEDYIEELALIEERARFLDVCLKPVAACDLMLHARKGPYQSTMDRKEIKIKRVPTQLAWELAKELEKRVVISDIHFARYKGKDRTKWKVLDIKDTDDFKNVTLKFAPSSALKALAIDALGVTPDETMYFADIDPSIKPVELKYAPFALAVGKPGNWNGAWPSIIHIHINHWRYYEPARNYARKDIDLTRRLYKHFGSPEPGDDDSELACMVGASRWKGFAVDIEALKQQRLRTIETSRAAPKAPNNVRRWLEPDLSLVEKAVIEGSTKKTILEEISRWTTETASDGSQTEQPVITTLVPHPAAVKAQAVLAARKATFEVKLYDKLIRARRFHASFIIIGTLSSRMSGTDQLNPQGINKREDVRSCFTFSDSGDMCSGGDFESFEVTIAEAVYKDPKLREELLKGKSIHGLFGMELFPGWTYEQIMATKGTADDKYTISKSGFFAWIFGAEGYTLNKKLGIPIEVADKAINSLMRKFPGIKTARQKIINAFCTMKQTGGIGTRIDWSEPADYVESLLGFRRYFTLENKICKVLFDLAQKPPESWKQLKIKVTRRDREQTTMGASQSALYAGAFALQAANMRAAGNHQIQSTGASITKHVQRKIWDLQPSGIHEWYVRPFNCHDEIRVVHKVKLTTLIQEVVDNTVEKFKSLVPLLNLDWKVGLKSWADK